jgi:hypothetical protein
MNHGTYIYPDLGKISLGELRRASRGRGERSPVHAIRVRGVGPKPHRAEARESGIGSIRKADVRRGSPSSGP